MKKSIIISCVLMFCVNTLFSIGGSFPSFRNNTYTNETQEKKYISIDVGDGDTLSLWCTKSDEYDDLYCFNYDGLEYMCDFEGNIVFCSNGEAELWFDEKGNNYYSKSTDIEIWNEFDRSGNIIHTSTNNGDEVWYEYKKGRLIHQFDTFGFDYKYEYDEKGNLSSSFFSTTNSWEKKEYKYNVQIKTIYKDTITGYYYRTSQKGYRVHVTDSKNDDFYYEYDLSGNILKKILSDCELLYNDGIVVFKKYRNDIGSAFYYDTNGRLTFEEIAYNLDPNKKIIATNQYEYDSNDKLVKQIKNNLDIGCISVYEYDSKGNVVHSYYDTENSISSCSKHDVIYEYDENNRLIYKKETVNGKNNEYWYDSKGKIKKVKASN